MTMQCKQRAQERPYFRPGASTRRRGQRGAASLIVVMVLFFMMSLVAAYTSRNLIFEQRTSVNQYRSTQAYEAAEAGLEWALAQLNGGRIDPNCLEADAAATDTSFRQRYLGINTNPPPAVASGMITALTQAVAGAPPRRAGCVWTGAAWSCSCPSDSNPALAAPVGGTGVYPAFWVSFSTLNVSRPGVVQIVATGCTRPDTDCLGSTANSTNVEGRALVTTLVALKGAIATPPVAALTVFGAVDRTGAVGTLSVFNTDGQNGGVTIQASGAVALGNVVLGGLPGTPGSESIVQNDPSMNLPAPIPAAGVTAQDREFASTFSMWPRTAQWQPGAVRLFPPPLPLCPATGCSVAVSNAVLMNPDRVIWVDGDLTLEAANIIGSLANPALIIVTGSLKVVPIGGVRVFGLIYTRSGNWSGSGEIQGAAIAEGDLAATAAQTVVYNAGVLDTLRLRAGSFVRVPGGWRDFP